MYVVMRVWWQNHILCCSHSWSCPFGLHMVWNKAWKCKTIIRVTFTTENMIYFCFVTINSFKNPHGLR